MSTLEQLAAVEAEHLHETGDDRDHDGRGGEPAEPAHRVDEVLVARARQDDTGEQDDAADPHGHREGVEHAHDDAEPGERSDRARDPDHRRAESGKTERCELRRGVDDTFGSERSPRRGEEEHQAQQHGAAGPPGIDEIEPGAGVERAPAAVRGDRLLLRSR